MVGGSCLARLFKSEHKESCTSNTGLQPHFQAEIRRLRIDY